jgi:hypothetical protein
MALHEMFALALSNIPENETDNFTAKTSTGISCFVPVLENLEGNLSKTQKQVLSS